METVTLPYRAGLEVPTWVLVALSTMPADFTGKMELNFFRGGVTSLTPFVKGMTWKAG